MAHPRQRERRPADVDSHCREEVLALLDWVYWLIVFLCSQLAIWRATSVACDDNLSRLDFAALDVGKRFQRLVERKG